MTLKRKNANGTWDEINAGGGSPEWGNITGTLSNQTDLTTALNEKVPTTRTVATIDLQNDITVADLFGALKSSIIDMLYPVGARYVQLAGMPEPSTFGGTWSVDTTYDGKAIWCDSTQALGTALAAQLPNIKGQINGWTEKISNNTGAFSNSFSKSVAGYGSGGSATFYNCLDFDANNSNSTYVNGGIVRPASMTCKVWLRTA